MSSRQHFDLPLLTKMSFLPIRLMTQLGMVDTVSKLAHNVTKSRGRTFFENYEPTAQDVIIATLARSGTHWMMQISLQIAFRGQADYDYIYDMVAWPEYFPQAILQLDEEAPESPTGLRIIKTHLEEEFVPVNNLAKYITVVRDPKEFFVSTYHFAPQAFIVMGWKQVSVQKWFDLFMSDYFLMGSWAEHTAGWWQHRHKPNVMVIPFNHLKADMEGHIDAISEMLGVKLTPDEKALVVKKASFSYMRERNHTFSPMPKNTKMMDVVRKGQTKTGSELLNQQQLDAIDERCKQELKRLGSDFPYDEIFGQ